MLCYRKIACTFVAALVLLCLGWEVQAESISIIASDNAWVKRDSATNDQNEAETLSVRNYSDSTKGLFTYLRFDVSPLAGATITSASLDLYWVSVSGETTVSVCALNDLANGGLGTTETSWSGNLTSNTAPSGAAKPPNTNTSGKLASLTFAPDDLPKKVVSFDLTSALPGLLASDTNNQLTFIMYGAGSQERKFASLANTGNDGPGPHKYPVPTLNVTLGQPIPEPGTFALLGMALLGLGWYAWRKRRR